MSPALRLKPFLAILLAVSASLATCYAGTGQRAHVPILQLLVPGRGALHFERYDLRLRVTPGGATKVMSRMILFNPHNRRFTAPARIYLPGVKKYAVSFDKARLSRARGGKTFRLSLEPRKTHVIKIVAVLRAGPPASCFLEIRKPIEMAMKTSGHKKLPEAFDPDPWIDLIPRQFRYRFILAAGYGVFPGGDRWKRKTGKKGTVYIMRGSRSCPVAAITAK